MKRRLQKRFRVRGLVAALCLCASAPAQASWLESCARLFSRASPRPETQVARTTHLPARKQDILVKGARGRGEPALRRYIAEANDALAEMNLPPRLDIDVVGDPQQIEYHYDSFRAVLPAHFAQDFSAEAEAMKRSFLQHEYGHAVFDENFARHSPEWRSWLESLRPVNSPVRRSVDLPPGLHKLTRAYQELFADLLTVVAQGDPRAVSTPLHRFTQMSGPRIDMRGFSGNAFSARWSEPEVVLGDFGPVYGLDPLKAGSRKVRKIRDEHLAFAPVRAYLWENYFSRPELKAERAQMLRIAFDSIATEILARHADPSLADLPFSLASARLLRSLDAALGAYKLK